jgi:hypothetical protein
MRVPLYLAASTTNTPIDMPLMIRLRIENLRRGEGAQLKF